MSELMQLQKNLGKVQEDVRKSTEEFARALGRELFEIAGDEDIDFSLPYNHAGPDGRYGCEFYRVSVDKNCITIELYYINQMVGNVPMHTYTMSRFCQKQIYKPGILQRIWYFFSKQKPWLRLVPTETLDLKFNIDDYSIIGWHLCNLKRLLIEDYEKKIKSIAKQIEDAQSLITRQIEIAQKQIPFVNDNAAQLSAPSAPKMLTPSKCSR